MDWFGWNNIQIRTVGGFMKLIRIDSNGFFLEDVIVEENTVLDGLITTQCPEGFYKPKWDGSAWTEGLSQTEIDIVKNLPQPKTELEINTERIASTEDAINIILTML